jgi:hypothetical protein
VWRPTWGSRSTFVAKDVGVLKTDVADVTHRLTGVEHRQGGVEDGLTSVEQQMNEARAPRRAPVRKRRK